ncbi:MFS transporter [Heyndrickxia sp. NPDC080065]|uniref:MFS transporter n=1 Tax=Heyndrickxia sp. NPDC080065 TaxID=3390568 RepID=UPI003CFC28C9
MQQQTLKVGEKNKVENNQRDIPFKDMVGYSFGAFGFMLMFMTVTTYLMYFYTDIMGISAAAAGTIFLIARLIDACFGPIVGTIADRTTSKHGKYRPFMLWCIIPFALTGVLMFTVPDFLGNGMSLVIYAGATYILFDLAYSFGNIPYLSMAGSMTFDPDIRTHLLSTKSVVNKISSIVATSLTLPLVHMFSDPKSGFFYTAIIYSIIAAIGIYIAFKTTKPYANVGVVVKKSEDKLKNRQLFTAIVKNNQLLSVVVSFLITSITSAIMGPAGIYYMTYNVGKTELISLYMLIGTFSPLVAVPVVSLFTKKFEKKTFLLTGYLMSALGSLFLYFTPYESVFLILASRFLAGVGSGLVGILIFSMIADCVDFGEWKTKIRVQGLTFAISVFFQKTGMAIGGWLLGILLTFIGYVPHKEQTTFSLEGILALNSWVPAIIFTLGIFVMFPYKLSKKKLIEIREEIDQRNI